MVNFLYSLQYESSVTVTKQNYFSKYVPISVATSSPLFPAVSCSTPVNESNSWWRRISPCMAHGRVRVRLYCWMAPNGSLYVGEGRLYWFGVRQFLVQCLSRCLNILIVNRKAGKTEEKTITIALSASWHDGDIFFIDVE